MMNGKWNGDKSRLEKGRPAVSVVIPTHGRPQLLGRAIRSVLRQSMQDFEVVVVLDGPDPVSASLVEDIQDVRVRSISLPQRSGGGCARNAGVAAARGRWIAFLDDDDEFLEQKLNQQLKAATQAAEHDTLVVCKAMVVGPGQAEVWPRRFPAVGEPLVEYLFCRKEMRQGQAFLQTSTFFLARELAMRIPFCETLARHQDWEWAVRLQAHGVEIIAVDEVLTVYHRGEGPSVSRSGGWKISLDWGIETVLPRSRRAFSFFVATQCVTRLTRREARSLKVLRPLARACFLEGRANVTSAFLFIAFWARNAVFGQHIPLPGKPFQNGIPAKISSLPNV
jgi:glycosyltransferase involved in cell wall biosynthesis